MAHSGHGCLGALYMEPARQREKSVEIFARISAQVTSTMTSFTADGPRSRPGCTSRCRKHTPPIPYLNIPQSEDVTTHRRLPLTS